MMMYFILGLIACLGLVSALFVLLIVFLRKNWNHACKSRLSFLAPILLVAVISYLSVTILVPMVFDFVQLVNRQYDVREIDIPDEAIPQNHSLILDGQRYYFPPGTFKTGEKGPFQHASHQKTLYNINVVRFGNHPAD